MRPQDHPGHELEGGAGGDPQRRQGGQRQRQRPWPKKRPLEVEKPLAKSGRQEEDEWGEESGETSGQDLAGM